MAMTPEDRHGLHHVAQTLGGLPSDLVPWLLREFAAAADPVEAWRPDEQLRVLTATGLRRETRSTMDQVLAGTRFLLTYRGRPIALVLPVRGE